MWCQIVQLYRETTGCMLGIQGQVIPTNYYRKYILKDAAVQDGPSSVNWKLKLFNISQEVFLLSAVAHSAKNKYFYVFRRLHTR